MLNLHLKFGAILSHTYKDMTLYPHMYQNAYGNLLKKNFSIQECIKLEKNYECFFMFGAILKAAKSSFQKAMTFCSSIYVKKFMKLLAFIFEHSSYLVDFFCSGNQFYLLLSPYLYLLFIS